MTYGPDEHRDAYRRILRVTNELGNMRDLVRHLRADLLDDAPDETSASRDHLRVVSQSLGSLIAALDNAANDLPVPERRAPIDWRALQRGGGHE